MATTSVETGTDQVRDADLEACSICGSRGTFGRTVRLRYGAIETCRACRSGILLPRPSTERLIDLHSSAEYFDHPYFEARRDLSPGLRAVYDERIAVIAQYCGSLEGKRMLDVGCDTGLFLGRAQNQTGVIGTGVDVSKRVVEEGRRAGLDLRHGTLDQVGFEEASFDVVSAYDVIEHVHDPLDLLAGIMRVLRPGGVCVIEAPNYDGLVYRLGRALGRLRLFDSLLRAYQERLWPPFHAQYFTPASLERCFRPSGLEPVHIGGREPASCELAIDGVAVRAAVLGVVVLAGAIGSNTLLTAVATKPG